MADFKWDFPSRMAINMHNEPLRLFWVTQTYSEWGLTMRL